MTEWLDRALEAVRSLTPAAQGYIARLVLQLAAEDAPPVTLTDEERAAIAISKAAAPRGEVATDDQVRADWAKYGL